MTEGKQHLVVEHADLELKRVKLQQFLTSEAFRTLSDIEQGLLRRQWASMYDYESILKVRIEKF